MLPSRESFNWVNLYKINSNLKPILTWNNPIKAHKIFRPFKSSKNKVDRGSGLGATNTFHQLSDSPVRARYKFVSHSLLAARAAGIYWHAKITLEFSWQLTAMLSRDFRNTLQSLLQKLEHISIRAREWRLTSCKRLCMQRRKLWIIILISPRK